MHHHFDDLHPCPDDHASDTVDVAAQILGLLRGYRGPFLGDPTIRLHLLASLDQQLHIDLLHATRDACEHGHTIDDIAALLDLPRQPDL